MTRSAPVAAIARCRPGQSAWSLRTKPRSIERRRRAPRSCIQPLAKASLNSPKRRVQVEPCTEGGATISARRNSALSLTSVAIGVSGSVDPGGAVGAVERLDRAVHEDRPDRAVDAFQDPLRLAEAVAHEQAGAARVGVAAPPVVDRGEQLGLRLPAVDRQAEGRFGDEAVAAHRLERRARRVVLARVGRAAGDVVVARRDPDPAAVLEPHLRRAEHVAGRMKAEAHAEVVDLLAVRERLQVDLAEARAQHAFGRRRGEVVRVAAPRVVAVRMRDHGALDRPPRVDVEIARRAVEAFLALDDQVAHGRSARTPTRPLQYRCRVANSAIRIAE